MLHCHPGLDPGSTSRVPEDIYNELIAEGFERVERDDRLLDVFPNEISEKGIELWDKWSEDSVEIIRIHIPKGKKGITRSTFSRKDIEEALKNNQKMQLA